MGFIWCGINRANPVTTQNTTPVFVILPLLPFQEGGTLVYLFIFIRTKNVAFNLPPDENQFSRTFDCGVLLKVILQNETCLEDTFVRTNQACCYLVTLGRKNPEDVEVESQRCLVSMFSFATQPNAEFTNHKQNKAVQEQETT